MQPQPGQVIARKYTLQKLIGRGGMGSVWRAHHDALNSPVAVKLLTKNATDELVIRFYREAQAAARLRSPNVVHVSDCGMDDGLMFIAMELLDGEDLRTRLQRARRLDKEAVYSIVRQVSRVLRKAHAAGIIHRDLKPGNLFLCQHDDLEVVKILDFGIAKSVFEQTITAPGSVMGTPAYMSPEQALGSNKLDHRTDIWSLAVITFRMLTGALPFNGTCGVQTIEAILKGEFSPPSRHVPTLGPAVDDFFRRAFSSAAEDRFQDAATFCTELASALELEARPSSAGIELSALSSSTPPAPRLDAPVAMPSAETLPAVALRKSTRPPAPSRRPPAARTTITKRPPPVESATCSAKTLSLAPGRPAAAPGLASSVRSAMRGNGVISPAIFLLLVVLATGVVLALSSRVANIIGEPSQTGRASSTASSWQAETSAARLMSLSHVE